MVKALLTFDAVRTIGLALPGVIESTMYGAPALKIHGNLLLCVPVNSSVEPNCVACMIDLDLRAALIKQDPKVYYVTDHYAHYPIVLVRLSRIGLEELRELLALAWNFVSAKKPTRSSSAQTSRVARGARNSKRGRPVPGKPGGRSQ